GGNHLGVVNDVVGVSDLEMQQIATDLGFSETVFIDWTDSALDPAVRIFTPVDELPFAGHPLVGAAWLLGTLGPVPARALRTKVGVVSCSAHGDRALVDASIEITEVRDDVVEVAALAGLAHPERTMRLALPKSYLMARFATFDDVEALDPDMDAFGDVFGFTAFARDGDAVKARFFAPASGIAEDPATGSAAVALAEVFRRWGEPEGSVTITQGDEIGYPSTIELAWMASSTTIGGTVRHDDVVLVP
ncbi:Phenazine biosynthesis protein PhzF like, partial [hydrothermal vent metagenome]